MDKFYVKGKAKSAYWQPGLYAPEGDAQEGSGMQRPNDQGVKVKCDEQTATSKYLMYSPCTPSLHSFCMLI